MRRWRASLRAACTRWRFMRRRRGKARSLLRITRWLEERRVDFRCCRLVILGEQIRQIEPAGEHGELAVGGARPCFLRPVPVKLDAVVVGAAQIECLADAV